MNTDKIGAYVGKYLVVTMVFPVLTIGVAYLINFPLIFIQAVFETSPAVAETLGFVCGGVALVCGLFVSFVVCRRAWRAMSRMAVGEEP